MKRIFGLTIAIVGVILFFTSCENDEIILPESEFFVAFDYKNADKVIVDTSSRFQQSVEVLKIPVFVAGKKTSAITVDFETAATDLNGVFTINPELNQSLAVEDVDFEILNSSKQLNFPDGVGYDTIFVRALNSGFTGHKFVFINLTGNSAGYNIGYQLGENGDSIVHASHRIRFY